MSAAEPRLVHAPGLVPRLRDKLPEILIEAASLGLAVLLALAIDGWREREADAALGRNVLAAVGAEIAANQREVGESVDAARAMLARLAPLLEHVERPPPGTEVDLNLPLALTSAAAWQAAMSGNALHTIGFERSTSIARIYELQRWFDDAQRRTLEAFASVSSTEPGQWDLQRVVLIRTMRELRMIVDFGESLQQAYSEHLNTRVNPSEASR